MAELFTQEWAEDARSALNTFPDADYRATKLDMYWDWIKAANGGFKGSLALELKDEDRFVTFTYADGEVASATVSSERPDATFILAGDRATWGDILDGYDAGKAVMYRRLRLVEGDVFRFFNRIYLFTESLVALSKVPATLPA
jgi:hypothetical protein